MALTTAGLMASIVADPAAEDYFRRALDAAGAAPEVSLDRPPRIAYAQLLTWRGDWEAAAALLAAERQVAERRGDEGMLMRLDLFGAGLALRRGRWDEADALLVAALGDARGYWRVTALVQRAFLRGRRGDPSAAADAAEIAASPIARADPLLAASADHALGLLAAARRDVVAAADLLGRCFVWSTGPAPGPPTCCRSCPRRWPSWSRRASRTRRRPSPTCWCSAGSSSRPGARPRPSCATGWCWEAPATLSARSGHLAAAREGFEAIDAPWELGQVLLAEGAALRRLGRRNDAAALLERAEALFSGLGADPARDRAREELARARPRPRSTDRPTAAERRVAALVSTGLTNKEVAAQLFTSVATVEAHLTRLYSKVGVRSRTQLARRVADGLLDVEP